MQQGAELEGNLEKMPDQSISKHQETAATKAAGGKIKATYRKIYGAGPRVTRNARTKAPYRLQVIEKLTIRTNRLKSPKRSFVIKI